MREFANTSTSTSTFTLALTKAGPNLGGPEHRELEILTLLTQGISANFPLRHTGNATQVPCGVGGGERCSGSYSGGE
jgi:hypothetical protein